MEYVKPAEAQFINTYVPLPFLELLTVANAYKQDYEARRAELNEFNKTYSDFSSLSDRDTAAMRAITTDVASKYAEKVAADPDYGKSLEGRSEMASIIANADYQKIARYRHSAKRMEEAAKQYDPRWAALGDNYLSTLANYSTDDAGIFNDTPIQYSDIATEAEKYFAGLQPTFLGYGKDKTGYTVDKYGIDDEVLKAIATPDTVNEMYTLPAIKKLVELAKKRGEIPDDITEEEYLRREIILSQLKRKVIELKANPFALRKYSQDLENSQKNSAKENNITSPMGITKEEFGQARMANLQNLLPIVSSEYVKYTEAKKEYLAERKAKNDELHAKGLPTLPEDNEEDPMFIQFVDEALKQPDTPEGNQVRLTLLSHAARNYEYVMAKNFGQEEQYFSKWTRSRDKVEMLSYLTGQDKSMVALNKAELKLKGFGTVDSFIMPLQKTGDMQIQALNPKGIPVQDIIVGDPIFDVNKVYKKNYGSGPLLPPDYLGNQQKERDILLQEKLDKNGVTLTNIIHNLVNSVQQTEILSDGTVTDYSDNIGVNGYLVITKLDAIESIKKTMPMLSTAEAYRIFDQLLTGIGDDKNKKIAYELDDAVFGNTRQEQTANEEKSKEYKKDKIAIKVAVKTDSPGNDLLVASDRTYVQLDNAFNRGRSASEVAPIDFDINK